MPHHTVQWDQLIQRRYLEHTKAKTLPTEHPSWTLLLVLSSVAYKIRRIQKDRRARIVRVQLENYASGALTSRELGWEETITICEPRLDKALLTERIPSSSSNPQYLMSTDGNLLTLTSVPTHIIGTLNRLLDRVHQHNTSHPNRIAADLRVFAYANEDGENLVDIYDYRFPEVR